MCACVEPIIDPLLPRKQGKFRRGKSIVGQNTFQTQEIEDSFSAKKKAGAVFADLAAAYDTVWHRGLTCKLLSLLLMFMGLVRSQVSSLPLVLKS